MPAVAVQMSAHALKGRQGLTPNSFKRRAHCGCECAKAAFCQLGLNAASLSKICASPLCPCVKRLAPAFALLRTIQRQCFCQRWPCWLNFMRFSNCGALRVGCKAGRNLHQLRAKYFTMRQSQLRPAFIKFCGSDKGTCFGSLW